MRQWKCHRSCASNHRFLFTARTSTAHCRFHFCATSGKCLAPDNLWWIDGTRIHRRLAAGGASGSFTSGSLKYVCSSSPSDKGYHSMDQQLLFYLYPSWMTQCHCLRRKIAHWQRLIYPRQLFLKPGQTGVYTESAGVDIETAGVDTESAGVDTPAAIEPVVDTESAGVETHYGSCCWHQCCWQHCRWWRHWYGWWRHHISCGCCRLLNFLRSSCRWIWRFGSWCWHGGSWLWHRGSWCWHWGSWC